jgi:hypothetical protein
MPRMLRKAEMSEFRVSCPRCPGLARRQHRQLHKPSCSIRFIVHSVRRHVVGFELFRSSDRSTVASPWRHPALSHPACAFPVWLGAFAQLTNLTSEFPQEAFSIAAALAAPDAPLGRNADVVSIKQRNFIRLWMRRQASSKNDRVARGHAYVIYVTYDVLHAAARHTGDKFCAPMRRVGPGSKWHKACSVEGRRSGVSNRSSRGQTLSHG